MLRVIPFLAGGLKYVCRYVFARLSADQKRRRGCSELEGRGEGKNECYAVLVQGPPVQTTQSLLFPANVPNVIVDWSHMHVAVGGLDHKGEG
jgi:hypothetical protein